MDIRRDLIMNRYIVSKDRNDEIFIDDRPFGVTDKLKRRLKLKNIVVYIEVILIALIFKTLDNKGFGFENHLLNVFIFFISSLVCIYITSKIIISKKLVKEEVVPINRMYR